MLLIKDELKSNRKNFEKVLCLNSAQMSAFLALLVEHDMNVRLIPEDSKQFRYSIGQIRSFYLYPECAGHT